MATLYIVATPIGNLEDMTFRALRILREVSLIAAEDTRTTRRLLDHFGIANRLLSYTEHNSATRTPQIIDILSESDVALVSEAGMPAISDPGARLVEAAYAAGVTVSPIPGPSALPAALAVAGDFPPRSIFLGFLPARSSERKRLLGTVAPLPFTLVIYEAPHRLQERLTELRAALGDRRIVVCRELTKLYEEIFRGTIGEALDHFEAPRGEFVLVLDGAIESEQTKANEPDANLNQAVTDLRNSGYAAKEAVAVISKRFGLSRRAAYALWLAGAKESERES